LKDVRCINAALVSDERTSVTLHQDETDAWLMTTSIRQGAWSGEQKTKPIEVPACYLGSLLQEPVELLKMDIEGSELAVMHKTKSMFGSVQRIRMELHATQPASLEEMLTMLKPYFSHLQATKRNQPVEDPRHFVGLCFVSADK